MSPALNVKRINRPSISMTHMSKHPVPDGHLTTKSGPGVKLCLESVLAVPRWAMGSKLFLLLCLTCLPASEGSTKCCSFFGFQAITCARHDIISSPMSHKLIFIAIYFLAISEGNDLITD